MIMWGGIFCCPYVDFNTGGRCRLATDTWVATSIVDALLARSADSGVWTAIEMIVWGGCTLETRTLLKTGGEYCGYRVRRPVQDLL